MTQEEAEFKYRNPALAAEIVRRAYDGGMRLTDIASALGVTTQAMHAWRSADGALRPETARKVRRLDRRMKNGGKR